MKTAEPKSNTTASSLQTDAQTQPFFQKIGESRDRSSKVKPFFSRKPPVQTKLTIGKPDDKYEQEADQMADNVVQKLNAPQVPSAQVPQQSAISQASTEPSPQHALQKQPDEDLSQEQELNTEKTEELVQKKPIFESNAEQPEADGGIQKKEDAAYIQAHQSSDEHMSGTTNTDNLATQLQQSKGKGSVLSDHTRGGMEDAFGADFSNVRVHTDSNAVQMNQNLGAQAFTQGSDIYFNKGKYDTHSNAGKHLLAHELTHTVQQGASKPSVQKAEQATSPVADGVPTKPNTPIDISHRLELNNAWSTYLDHEHENGRRIFDLDVKIGERYSGTIKVNKKRATAAGENAKYELSRGNHKYLDTTGWSALNPMRRAGVHPILVLRNFGDDQQTTGFLSVRMGEAPLITDIKGFIGGLNSQLEQMCFLGVEPINVSINNFDNVFENGRLLFQVNSLSTAIDGYLDAGGGMGITGDSFTFNLKVDVDLAGLAKGEFAIALGEDGNLSGRGQIDASIANVQATIIAEYIEGIVTIQGTGRMESEKFSGEITLLVTDADRSKQMMNAALGVETIEASGVAPVDQAAVPKTKNNQVLAGWGEVNASITPWLEGTAKIGIDHQGHVTIVGEIAVPDEIELMEQRGKKVQIFDVEIRAGYGIPLVGQVFLFAGVGMFVNAGFGPLVLKNVAFTGTYSTDPTVLQQFSITGTLGINAFAVLGLEAEAGVGVTLLGHDVKAGVNVTAAAGLRAYAEATPTFEYTESTAPEGGKVGESRLKGHFEAAAQLFLQLSGALFYELDSPWWSPAPDGREDFPLGEVQYPIGDSLGIGADVDWLVGSEEPPELNFSKVEFDPDKFTADVMADPPPRKLGDSDANPDGQWEDGQQGDQQANPEVTGDGEGLPAGSRREENLRNLPDEQKYMRALDELSRLENAEPKPTEAVVESKIRRVKSKYGIDQIQLRDKQDDNVSVFVRHARGDNGKHLLAIPLMGEAERGRLLAEAMRDLRTRERNEANDDRTIEESTAVTMLQEWRTAHPVIETARIVEGGETWDYLIDIGDRNSREKGILKKDTADSTNTDDIRTIIGVSSRINTDGGHTLIIDGTVERVDINVYSDKKTLNNLLNEKRQEIHDNGKSDPGFEDKSRAIENLFSEKGVLGKNIGAYRRAVDNAYSPGNGNEPIRIAYNLIATNLANMAADLEIIGVLDYAVELPISRVSFETDSKGRAYILRAAPISRLPGNTRGSTPTQDPRGWTKIPVSLRKSGAWVRAHMLNHRLHGPGTRNNLFPGTRDMNLRDMENQVEHFAKAAVWDNNQVIFYNVDVSYGNDGEFEDIPTVVVMSFGPYNTETNLPESPTLTKRFVQDPPNEVQQINFNSSSASSLKKVAENNNVSGLQGMFFNRLVEGREATIYSNISDIRKTVRPLYSDLDAFNNAFNKLRELMKKVTIIYGP